MFSLYNIRSNLPMHGKCDPTAHRGAVRWEVAESSSFYGSLLLYDVFKDCQENKGKQKVWNSDMLADGRWQFNVNIADRDSDWIGIYLSFAGRVSENSLCALFHTAHKHGERLLAEFTMDEPHYFGDSGWAKSEFCSMNTILLDEAIQKNDNLTLEYVIYEYPRNYTEPTLPVKLRPSLTTLCEMMALMFDDASTADVRFVIMPSARFQKGPGYIHAHSNILSARSDYFETLFSLGFSAGEERTSPSDDTTHGTANQDVKNDSDCEELEEDWLSAGGIPEVTSDSADPSTSVEKPEYPGDSARKYKTVYITDASYRTYRGLLYYLYTGCVSFAPLRSTYKVAREEALATDPHAEFPTRLQYNDANALVISPDSERGRFPWVSAKAVYKSCDTLDIDDLKTAASEFIHNSLTPETVFAEFHSSFTSMFPEVLDDQDEYIQEHWSASAISWPVFSRSSLASRAGDG